MAHLLLFYPALTKHTHVYWFQNYGTKNIAFSATLGGKYAFYGGPRGLSQGVQITMICVNADVSMIWADI